MRLIGSWKRYFDVYSDIPRDIRRILRAAEAFGCEVHATDHGGVRCLLPLRALTFRASKGGKGNTEALMRKREEDAANHET